MKAMNKVASHINEMQKLHEEYGAVFDQLINEQTADKKEVKKKKVMMIRIIIIKKHLNLNASLFPPASGGGPVHGRSSASLHRGLAQPSCLFGQEQEGSSSGRLW